MRRFAAVLVVLIVLLTACKGERDDDGSDSPRRKKATSSATNGPAAPASAVTAASVTLDPSQGALPALLKAEAAKARAMHLAPYAEFRADWCGPCRAIEKSMDDPRMIAAFAGTYVAHLDVDAWGSAQTSAAGFDASAIPVFFELDADGKPTGRKIDGGAWGDNVPENMAPPLAAFFHPKGAAAPPPF